MEKIYQKRLKLYTKTEKIIIKFSDTEIGKKKFHQHKRPISIKNIDINRSLLVKRISNISLAAKMLKN